MRRAKLRRVTVHSALPAALTTAVDGLLSAAGIVHVAHGTDDPVAAASAAVEDAAALALIGPYRSHDVAEALEVSAPAGLALLAPVATAAGVTRADEPGGTEDPARHLGTVLRLIARDTEVARRIARDLQRRGQRAFVIAGEHEYGAQLDGQLELAGLPRAEHPDAADLIVLAGLAGQPEIERARSLAPLPIIAFDGVQGADLGAREVRLALPHAPVDGVGLDDLFAGVHRARVAATMLLDALAAGANDRATMLTTLREHGGFDAHGDPPDPPVWLWHADPDWTVRPDRPL